MCITKVESFDFAGKLYPTELDAISAALTEIATSIVKQHSAHPLQGLMEHAEKLPGLLMRHQQLTNPDTPTEVTSENSQKGPKRTRTVRFAFNRVDITKAYNCADAASIGMAQKHMAANGFTDIISFLQGASRQKIARLCEILDMYPESIG